MTKVKNSESLAYLTSTSTPRISEVVDLFEKMSVSRCLDGVVRIINSEHDHEPLGVGGTPSRFSSTELIRRKFSGAPMKVLYGARTIDTAIYETLVRNRFDINPIRFLDSTDYENRSVVSFSTKQSQKLNLLDLTQGKATCYGVPTDVIRSSDHIEGQHFSQFVFENMPNIAGFIYSSRFTEEECIALFHSKVITKLNATIPVPLNMELVKFAMVSKNVKVE